MDGPNPKQRAAANRLMDAAQAGKISGEDLQTIFDAQWVTPLAVLPTWNDLPEEQRLQICGAGDYWVDGASGIDGADIAAGMYNSIRDFLGTFSVGRTGMVMALRRVMKVKLESFEAALPTAPWTVWSSNSHRRIGGPSGADGDVLHAYRQRPDGHPDLSMPEQQLQALVELRNQLPGLINLLGMNDPLEVNEGASEWSVGPEHPANGFTLKRIHRDADGRRVTTYVDLHLSKEQAEVISQMLNAVKLDCRR